MRVDRGLLPRRSRRWRATLLAAAIGVAGCSVSTPRNGLTVDVPAGAAAPDARSVPADAAAPATSADPVGGVPGDTGPSTASTSTSPEFGDRASAPQATSALASEAPPDPSTGDGSSPGPPDTTTDAGVAEVGVTDDTLTISVVAGFSGPNGALVEKLYGTGFGTWLHEVNSNGGIHGRTVVVKKVDHQGTVDGHVAACREVLSNGTFIAVFWEGGFHPTFAGCTEQAAYPILINVPTVDPAWQRVFTWGPTFDQHGATLASYVSNVMGDGDKKLGVIYTNEATITISRNGFVAEAQRLGMQVVHEEVVEPGQASFVPQLARMRDKGVENLAIITTLEAVGILRDARAINYQPHFSGAIWPVSDEFSTAARDTARGVGGVRVTATVDSPAWGKFRTKAVAAGHQAASLTSTDMAIYGIAAFAGEALASAGPQPTRDGLVAGVEGIRGYDNGIIPPVSFGPGVRIGTDASWPTVCCNPDWTWQGTGAPLARF